MASGAAGLAVEVCATRFLAPYFGASTVVWANVIGLILACLAAGSWLGGRAADRHPSRHPLGVIILAAAVMVALLPLVARPVLNSAVTDLNRISAGAAVGSFIGALLLFAGPVTLLGMVAPWAVRLSVVDVESAGRSTGRLYALSALGSIGGTFLPALIMIPLIGTERTMICVAALLTGCSVPLVGRRAFLVVGGASLALLIPPTAIRTSEGVIADHESAYQYVRVMADRDGTRTLELNEGVTAHSVWRPNTVLTGGEWDMFLMVPPLVHHPVSRVLILGNAGGTMARAFAAFYPDADIDGVEIDPAVTEAGQRFLGLGDNPKLHTITADGRAYLNTTNRQYDIVIVDAYRQPYVPFQLATSDFFAQVRGHLVPGGIVALNVEAIPGDNSLPDAIESTVSSQFASSWVWQPLRYNELVLGVNASVTREQLTTRARAVNPSITSLARLFEGEVRPARTTGMVLTDDRAPVEWLTDRTIIRYVAGGGRLDERLLPTHP